MTLPDRKKKLLLDSLESALRQGENRRTRKDMSEGNRIQWCLVSIEASKALVDASKTFTADSSNVKLDKKQLQNMAESLSSIMKLAEAKRSVQGGTAKGYISTPVRQTWCLIAIQATMTYLAVAKELGVLGNDEEANP